MRYDEYTRLFAEERRKFWINRNPREPLDPSWDNFVEDGIDRTPARLTIWEAHAVGLTVLILVIALCLYLFGRPDLL